MRTEISNIEKLLKDQLFLNQTSTMGQQSTRRTLSSMISKRKISGMRTSNRKMK
jgi:hypothetical protein